MIYRDYLCDEKEKSKLLEKDKIELNNIEEKLRKKYNTNILFKNRNHHIEKISRNEQISEMIVYKKESFVRKILNMIIGFFRK